MAFQGGPMNTNPASVHFRAKAEFSLSFPRSFMSYLHRNVVPGLYSQIHSLDVSLDSPPSLQFR